MSPAYLGVNNPEQRSFTDLLQKKYWQNKMPYAKTRTNIRWFPGSIKRLRLPYLKIISVQA